MSSEVQPASSNARTASRMLRSDAARPRSSLKAGTMTEIFISSGAGIAGALERLSIPLSQIGCGLVGGLEKRAEEGVGLGGFAHDVVRQHELAEVRTVEGALRLHHCLREAGRLGIGVGIKGGVRNGATAGPEAATADFVRVRLARNPIRQVWN